VGAAAVAASAMSRPSKARPSPGCVDGPRSSATSSSSFFLSRAERRKSAWGRRDGAGQGVGPHAQVVAEHAAGGVEAAQPRAAVLEAALPDLGHDVVDVGLEPELVLPGDEPVEVEVEAGAAWSWDRVVFAWSRMHPAV